MTNFRGEICQFGDFMKSEPRKFPGMAFEWDEKERVFFIVSDFVLWPPKRIELKGIKVKSTRQGKRKKKWRKR